MTTVTPLSSNCKRTNAIENLTMKHCALTLIYLLTLRSVVLASDPPPAAAPSPTPSPIVEVYGSPAGEPKLQLKWSVYLPAGSGPWPAVLVIHAGGFKHGSRNDNEVVQ